MFVQGKPKERDERIDAILGQCRYIYTERLNEDDQVAFKGKAKSFVRSYDFLATILTYDNPAWEKLSIFLTLLVRALPPPKKTISPRAYWS